MGEHRALRATGRARGISDERRRLRSRRIEKRNGAVRDPECRVRTRSARGELGERGALLGIVDDRGPGTGVLDHVGELPGAVRGVGRDHYEPEAEGGDVARHQIGGALGGEQDAVARLEAEGREPTRTGRGLPVEVTPREPAPIRIMDRRGVGAGTPMSRPGRGEAGGVPRRRVEGSLVGQVDLGRGHRCSSSRSALARVAGEPGGYPRPGASTGPGAERAARTKMGSGESPEPTPGRSPSFGERVIRNPPRPRGAESSLLIPRRPASGDGDRIRAWRPEIGSFPALGEVVDRQLSRNRGPPGRAVAGREEKMRSGAENLEPRRVAGLSLRP